MFDQITASIQSIAGLSSEQLSMLLSKLTTHYLVKDEYLVKEGQTCQSLYFIHDGLFRHYTIEDATGEEVTLNLFLPGDWLLEYKSFMMQRPSHNRIQAIDNSVVFSLSVWDFHELARSAERFFRLGSILETVRPHQDFTNSRFSPELKYQRLLEIKPELLHHFPLKYIASLLGITPETLSRVRKKISS